MGFSVGGGNTAKYKPPSRVVVAPWKPPKYTVVVAPPRKPPKVVVKPYVPPTKKLVVKPITPTSKPYNPQPAGKGIPAKPAPPVSKVRVFTTYKFDQQGGRLINVKNVANLTDRQWELKQVEAKATAVINGQLNAFRKEHGNSLNYDSKLYGWNQDQQAGLAAEFEDNYKAMAEARSQVYQKWSQSKSQEEAEYYQAQIEQLDSDLSDFQDLQSAMSNSLNTQIKMEHDRNRSGVLGGLGQVLGKGLDTDFGPLKLNDLFRYTIGEGSETIPSLIDAPLRAGSFYANVVNPSREVEVKGERGQLAKGLSVSEAWKLTQGQSAAMSSRFAETGKIGYTDFFAQSLKDIPGISPGLANTIGNIIAEALLDPTTAIGGREVKTATKFVKGTKFGAKVGRATSVTGKALSKMTDDIAKSIGRGARAAGLADEVVDTIGATLKSMNPRAPATPKGTKAKVAQAASDVQNETRQRITGLQDQLADANFNRQVGFAGIRKLKSETGKWAEDFFKRFKTDDDIKKFIDSEGVPKQGLNETDKAFAARKNLWNDQSTRLQAFNKKLSDLDLGSGNPRVQYDPKKGFYFPKGSAKKTKAFDYAKEFSEDQPFAQAKRAKKEAQRQAAERPGFKKPQEKAGFATRRVDDAYQKAAITANESGVRLWSDTRPRQLDNFDPKDQQAIIDEMKQISKLAPDRRTTRLNEFFEKYPLTPSEWLAADQVKTFQTKAPKAGRFKRAASGALSKRAGQTFSESRLGPYKVVDDASKTADDVAHEIALTSATGRAELDNINSLSNIKKVQNVAKDVPFYMSTFWKDAVLTFNPAWYVNNEIFNVVSAITEAGPKALINRFDAAGKMVKYSLDTDQLKQLAGFVESTAGGKLKRRSFARWQERNARYGVYITRRQQGLTHDAAMLDVAAALGDYTNVTKLSKGISTVIPFWEWQKFITKRIVTMPLRTPRGAQVWSKVYTEFYEKPLDQLPDENMTITDPDTGEEFVYNPRQQMQGKAYNPIDGKWYNTPFNAFTPDQIATFGVNPLIQAFREIATNRDKWGNRLDSQSYWERFATKFPQFNVGKAQLAKPEIQTWLAAGSGFPKERTLPPRTTAWDALKRFAGVPTGVKFDPQKFADNKQAAGFRSDWFATDWSKDNPKWQTDGNYDYGKVKAEQERIAKKHGYDNLQEDVYGTSSKQGLFNKYDTAFTMSVKKQKEEARAITDTFWETYEKNKANKTSQFDPVNAKFVQESRQKWERDATFINNPEIRNLLQEWFFRGPDTNTKGRDLTDPDEYFKYRAWIESGGALAEAKAAGLAEYKKSPKGKFWEEYHRLKEQDKDKASAYYKANYKNEYAGKTPTKPKFTAAQTKEFEFWKKYIRTSPVQQAKMREQEPQYFKEEFEPRTGEELDAARATRRIEEDKKLALVAGFGAGTAGGKRGIKEKARKSFIKRRRANAIWKVR